VSLHPRVVDFALIPQGTTWPLSWTRQWLMASRSACTSSRSDGRHGRVRGSAWAVRPRSRHSTTHLATRGDRRSVSSLVAAGSRSAGLRLTSGRRQMASRTRWTRVGLELLDGGVGRGWGGGRKDYLARFFSLLDVSGSMFRRWVPITRRSLDSLNRRS
jgi:hypothetical protein